MKKSILFFLSALLMAVFCLPSSAVTYTVSPEDWTPLPNTNVTASSGNVLHGNLIEAKGVIVNGNQLSIGFRKNSSANTGGSTFQNDITAEVRSGSATGTVLQRYYFSAGSALYKFTYDLDFTSGSKKYVLVVCSKGSSTIYYYTSPITVTASGGDVPSTPDYTTFRSSNITETSFKAIWSSVTGATKYNVLVKKASDSNYDNPVFSGSTTTNSISVTGLTPGTSYQFQVQAVNSYGKSGWSKSIASAVTTSQAKPSLTLASAMTFQTSNSSTTTLIKGESYTFSCKVKNTGSSEWKGAFYLKVNNSDALSFSKTISSGSSTTLQATYTPDITGSVKYYLYYQTGGQGEGVLVSSGSYSNPISITINAPLATPDYTTFKASSITETSFKASWTSVSGATKYNVNVKKASDSNYDNPVFSSSTTTNSISVTGLTPGTSYHFQVQAVNASGKSGWSKSIASAVTTSQAKPSLTLASAMTFQTDNSSVTTLTKGESYTFSTKVKNTGSAQWKGVFYLKIGNSNQLTFSKTIAAGSSATLSEIYTPEVTGNVQYSLYYQTGGEGEGVLVSSGSYSNPISITINAPLSTPDYRTFDASGITEKSFTASWGGVSGATKYNVLVKKSSDATYDNPVFSGSSTKTSINVSGLAPGTSYHFQVQAENASGKSGWSKSIASAVTTKASSTTALTLASPMTFQTSNNSATTLTKGQTYTFTTKVKNTGNTSWKGAFYLKLNDQTNALTFSKTIAAGSSATLSDLYVPDTEGDIEYYLYYQTGGEGQGILVARGSYSNPISITVEGGLSSPDYRTFDGYGISGTGFTASWSAVSGATKYNILVKKSTDSNYNNPVFSGSTTKTSINVTGLTPGTSYHFQVQAENASGKSSWSKSIATAITTVSASTTVLTLSSPMTFQTSSSSTTTLTKGQSYTFSCKVKNTGSESWKGAFYLKLNDQTNALTFSKTVAAGSSVTLSEVYVPDIEGDAEFYLYYQTGGEGKGELVARGSFSNPIAVTVSDQLSTPDYQTFSASSISETGFTANWEAVPGATKYNVLVKKSSDANYSNPVFSGTTSKTNINVTGLNPGTSYHFQVQAENASGKSNWSKGIATAVTTKSSTAAVLSLASPLTFQTSSTSTTKLTVGQSYAFSTKVKNTGTTSWTGAFYLKLNDKTDALTFSKTIAAGSSVTLFDSYIPEYSGDAEYYLYYQTGGKGEGVLVAHGNYANPISVTVIEPQTSLATPNHNYFRASDITGTGFTAHWNEVSNATKYNVLVAKSSDKNFTMPVFQTTTSSTYAEVTGLTPGQFYCFRVQALSNNAQSGWSSSSNEIATKSVSNSLTIVNGTFFGTNSLTVNQTYPFTAKVKNTGSSDWKGTFYLKGDDENWLHWTLSIKSGQTVELTDSYTPKNAGSKRLSLFYQTNSDGDGSLVDAGNYVNPVSINISAASTGLRTPESSTFTATDITETSFIAHWEKIDDATQYDINIKKENATYDANMLSGGSMSNYYKVTGLEPGTSYQFQVRAKNLTDKSGWSHSSQAITTLAGTPSEADLSIYSMNGFGTTELVSGSTYKYQTGIYNNSDETWSGSFYLKDGGNDVKAWPSVEIAGHSGYLLEFNYTPKEANVSKKLTLYYLTKGDNKGTEVPAGKFSNPIKIKISEPESGAANIVLSSAIDCPQEVALGTTVPIKATIVNNGNKNWTGKLSIEVDRVPYKTENASLSPNGTFHLSASWTPKTAGKHNIGIYYITGNTDGQEYAVSANGYANPLNIDVTQENIPDADVTGANVTLITRNLAPKDVPDGSVVFYHYRVKDKNGNPLKGLKIHFSGAGSSYGKDDIYSSPSDADGIATLTLNAYGDDPIGKAGDDIFYRGTDLLDSNGKTVKLENFNSVDHFVYFNVLKDNVWTNVKKFNFGFEVGGEAGVDLGSVAKARGEANIGLTMGIAYDGKGKATEYSLESELNGSIGVNTSKEIFKNGKIGVEVNAGIKHETTANNLTDIGKLAIVRLCQICTYGSFFSEQIQKAVMTIVAWDPNAYDEETNAYLGGKVYAKLNLSKLAPDSWKLSKPFNIPDWKPNDYAFKNELELGLTPSFKYTWIEGNKSNKSSYYGSSTKLGFEASLKNTTTIKALDKEMSFGFCQNTTPGSDNWFDNDLIGQRAKIYVEGKAGLTFTTKELYKDANRRILDQISETTALKTTLKIGTDENRILSILPFGANVSYSSTENFSISSKGDFLKYMVSTDNNKNKFKTLFPDFENTSLIASPAAIWKVWTGDVFTSLPELTAEKKGVSYPLDEALVLKNTSSTELNAEIEIPICPQSIFECSIKLGGNFGIENAPRQQSFYSVADGRLYPVVKQPSRSILDVVGSIYDNVMNTISNCFTPKETEEQEAVYNHIVEKKKMQLEQKKATMPSSQHASLSAFRGNRSPAVRRYQELEEQHQSDICRFTFDFAPDYECFDSETELNLESYYPAGSLFGITDFNDTLFVVSEVVGLTALLGADTLATSTYGSMQLDTYVGIDDLTPFGLNENTPLGVYHSNLDSNDWHYVGPAGTTLYVDSIGSYMIATSIKNDLIAPSISAEMDSINNVLYIMIKDNISVRSNTLQVFISDELREAEALNENTFVVYLTDEDLKDLIVLRASVYDLAGNLGTTTRFFNVEKATSIEKVLSKDDLKFSVEHKVLTIEGAEPDAVVAIYSISGEMVGQAQTNERGNARISLRAMDTGTYVVTLSTGQSAKFFVK